MPGNLGLDGFGRPRGAGALRPPPAPTAVEGPSPLTIVEPGSPIHAPSPEAHGSCVLFLPVPAWETAPKRGSVSVTLGRPDQVDIPKECRVPVHGVLPVEFTANLKPGHYLPELVVALGPDEWGTMILMERPFEVVSKTATRIELSCAPKYAPGS